MSDPQRDANEEGLAFLRDLIDRYGVQGLTDRLAGAIEEAEEGRVAGPALDEATAWIEQEHGPQVASFAGEARLTISASGAAGAIVAGSAHLHLTAGTTGETVVHKVVQDLATATDQAALSVTETARVVVTNLPTNMQVLAQVHDTFLYLVGLWGLLGIPIEVVPFLLLMTLAIVVLRIAIKRG